jgi:hypothetical protein
MSEELVDKTWEIFAFIRGLQHWDGFIWENHGDWRRAVVAVSEAFNMTEEEALAAVERFKKATA